MNVLRELGTHPLPAFRAFAELANVYCNGIKTQRDDSSPTGYWRGMLARTMTTRPFAASAQADGRRPPAPANAARLLQRVSTLARQRTIEGHHLDPDWAGRDHQWLAVGV